jgi:hypothetical protein
MGHSAKRSFSAVTGGIQRVAAWLEKGDLAMAGIEAVLLAFPEIDPDGMAKLAKLADLTKGGDAWLNEPRIPAGQPDGGQWTTGGAATGAAAPRSRRPARSAPTQAMRARPQPRVVPPTPRQRLGPWSVPTPSAALRPRQRAPGLFAEQSDSPVSTVVDVSNAVAGSLVDFAHWLGQPQTYVPIAPEIAAGEPAFPVGPALEETTDPHALRDWRPVSHLEAAADVVSVVGVIAPAARVVAEDTEIGGEVARFGSFAEFKQHVGSPGAGNHWHHIVEQTPGNLEAFGPEALHNTRNVVAVPKSVHVGRGSISAYYSSKRPFTNGRTVRQWLAPKSFQAQRRFGIRTLRTKFGRRI